MTIKRINEFPENSGSLSSDDVFLFMDDPNGEGVTKKISLTELSSALSISNNATDTGDITFNVNVISTANEDEDIILDPNGSGNVVIGTNKNLILDINAFTAEGIKIIDSTEDGYDDPEIPSVLKVGSIYHSIGNMVIQSDGAIYPSGDPSTEINAYGGLIISNKDNTASLFLSGPVDSFFASGIAPIPTGTIGVNGTLLFDNNTSLAKGTFDNSTGGQGGISLNCAVGYELNWQGGHLRSTADNGISSSNILMDSAIEFPGTGIASMTIDNLAITYPDGTTQSTAPSVTDLVAGTGINIESVSGIYTISSSGEASVIKTTVFNETGSSIPKFSVIYINGGHGDMPTIDLAVASGEATSSKSYGITATNIDNMNIGSVIVLGALNGLNTDQFNPTAPTGDVNGVSLWLSPTTPGGVTTTKPSAPNHAVYVGTIIRTHQNQGIVEVRIQNGYELEELHNVKINNIANKDILVYNSGTSVWENTNTVVFSNPSGITGATAINNIVQISQADYNNLVTTDPNTLYVIN